MSPQPARLPFSKAASSRKAGVRTFLPASNRLTLHLPNVTGAVDKGGQNATVRTPKQPGSMRSSFPPPHAVKGDGGVWNPWRLFPAWRYQTAASSTLRSKWRILGCKSHSVTQTLHVLLRAGSRLLGRREQHVTQSFSFSLQGSKIPYKRKDKLL